MYSWMCTERPDWLGLRCADSNVILKDTISLLHRFMYEASSTNHERARLIGAPPLHPPGSKRRASSYASIGESIRDVFSKNGVDSGSFRLLVLCMHNPRSRYRT